MMTLREDLRLSTIAIALASVLVTLAVGELVVRVFDLGPTFFVVFRETIVPSENPLLGYELRPGAKDGRTRISSTGLRNKETPLAKPDGVFRIAAIGDSVTFGSFVFRKNGWVVRLERLLNESATADAPRFEVLNFGVPGYHIGQVVERLRGLGLAHQPDAIIYGYVLNDLEPISTEAMALDDLRAAQEERFRDPFRSRAARWLSHSRLVLMARYLLTRSEDEIPRPQARVDPTYAASKKDQVVEYLRSLHTDSEARARLAAGMQELADMAKSVHAPVLVAIFPLMTYPGSDYPLANVHALVATEAHRHGFAVIDLREPLAAARAQSSRPIHSDFLHPSVDGNRVIARALFDALYATRILPSANREARSDERPSSSRDPTE